MDSLEIFGYAVGDDAANLVYLWLVGAFKDCGLSARNSRLGGDSDLGVMLAL
jgi:hypothetical protein